MQLNEANAFLFHKLFQKDVCIRCIFRIFKISDIGTYRDTSLFHQLLIDVGKIVGQEDLLENYDFLRYKQKGQVFDTEQPFQQVHSTLRDQFIKTPYWLLEKINKCSICLGILQCMDDRDFIKALIKEVQSKEYQFEAFKFQVKIPIGCAVRQTIIVNECVKELALQDKQDSFYQYVITPNFSTDIKVCVKWIICHLLSEGLKVPSDANDDRFTICLNFENLSDDIEQFKQFKDIIEQIDDLAWEEKITKKLKMNDPKLKAETHQRLIQKKNQQNQPFLPTQGNLEKVYKLRNDQMINFKVLNHHFPVKLEINTNYQNIFIKGNYIKLARYVSQTPWVIDGKLIYEESIEDLVSKEARLIFKPSSVKFHSGGREDIDVRMLGNGRPFAIELVDPHSALIAQTQEMLINITEKINQGNIVQVTPLQFTDSSIFNELKNSEINKVKAYCCIVECKNEVNEELIKKANEMTDILIKQKTPLRVLHRRTLMIRDKIIHGLKIIKINAHWLIVYVLSSAGTYIKEFVHSDLDRTTPNLCTILENECDIFQLDVIKLYEKIEPDVLQNFYNLNIECGCDQIYNQ